MSSILATIPIMLMDLTRAMQQQQQQKRIYEHNNNDISGNLIAANTNLCCAARSKQYVKQAKIADCSPN